MKEKFEDCETATEDLLDLMKLWCEQGLDTKECMVAGLTAFLDCIFSIAPDKEEVHNVMTLAFLRSSKTLRENMKNEEQYGTDVI